MLCGTLTCHTALACPGVGRERDHGVSEQTEVLARNLAEVTEDIWKLWVLFFQQLPAFGKMRAGRVPRKMRLLKK